MSFSQIYELGFTYGKSNFIGDVGNTTFINPSENTFGAIFKWNRSARHSYRISYNKSTLSANDLDSSDPRRIERGYILKLRLMNYHWVWNLIFWITTYMIMICCFHHIFTPVLYIQHFKSSF